MLPREQRGFPNVVSDWAVATNAVRQVKNIAIVGKVEHNPELLILCEKKVSKAVFCLVSSCSHSSEPIIFDFLSSSMNFLDRVVRMGAGLMEVLNHCMKIQNTH